jgi:WhiB family transcriptional regulator, redox-sensing transcriptional regulator
MADWRHSAICKDEDPELFFPIGDEHTTGKAPSGPVQLQHAEAKTVCRRCPVVTDCLTWAITTGQAFGVSGGMTPNERRALKRRTPARAH